MLAIAVLGILVGTLVAPTGTTSPAAASEQAEQGSPGIVCVFAGAVAILGGVYDRGWSCGRGARGFVSSAGGSGARLAYAGIVVCSSAPAARELHEGESRQLRTEGNRFLPAFLLAVVLIFLVLAARHPAPLTPRATAVAGDHGSAASSTAELHTGVRSCGPRR